MHARSLVLFAIFALAMTPHTLARAAESAGWKAGVAKIVITPERPMWMSGYSSRDHAAEGKLHDLWAKALVLEDAAGQRAVLVTLDLVGIDRLLSLSVRDALEKNYGLTKRQIAINCSHTHTGPVVSHNLRTMYSLDEQQSRLVDEYTAALEKKIIALVGEAIQNLAPAAISWGGGETSFAVNRRNNPEPDVPALIAEGKLKGPVDHQVPVLAVNDAGGKLKTVVFGYACHATALSFYQWTGDWPGFAMIDLEKEHLGTVAMFWAGCGADQNPLPRRTVELAEKYGHEMATAVDQVLAGEMTPIAGKLSESYAEIDLSFATLPTREELTAQAASNDKYQAARAKMLLAQIAAGKPLSPTYPYPVQVWRLGNGPVFVTLGGEVVVDYALRLEQEYPNERMWVAGYTNDVMAYIPSRRVLTEGGYEGAGAMVYYGLPTAWAPDVEEKIIREVHQQIGKP
ncbi:MAG TPA: neutral/alkaline non-lysosomal ceramidase N-terminal domain-containing protein [Pirellulales bacterium]|nr:neutral/alkaline non-lysosomal ceramidase N-terminal domain-containing protein [Pirellulales bacterium]